MEKRKIESVKQLPVMPLTVEDMTWNKTGTWRLLTPRGPGKDVALSSGLPDWPAHCRISFSAVSDR